MRDRTLVDAERDYDDALATGARAVQIMDEKLARQKRDAMQMLSAIVMSSGGKVEITGQAMMQAYDADLTITENLQTLGWTITAKRKI